MIPKPSFKLKSNSTKESNSIRCSTDYQPMKKSAYFKNKLTKGCNNYEQLKDAYLITDDNIQTKTQYNQYTFQPKLSGKKSNSRSFRKFLEDQENFQQNKECRIKEFKTEVSRAQASQCTNRPSIDKISRRICTLMSYDKEEVVDRLYKKKVIDQYKDNQELFSPKILPRSKSMKRNQNVSELLHEDAMRRKAKKDVLEAEKLLAHQPPSTINSNTYGLVCNKMYIQFCELAPQDEETLSLVMAWTVISEMFGIELNPNKTGREGKICEDIAHFLCQDGKQTVSRNKLWQFIQILVKKQEAKPKLLGGQIHQIIQQFGNLYTFRMAKPKTQRDGEQYPFFPETLRSSEGKAQKYREKLLDQAKQFLENSHSKVKLKQQVTIQDIFLIDHMMRQASNEKKKLEKEQKQMQQCTFKPRLSQSYRKPVQMPPRVGIATSKVSDSKKTLFKSTSSVMMSANQSFMSQSLKSIDFKSNLKHFKPSHQKSMKNSTLKEIKNIDKSIMRMTIARKQRQLSNQIKNRGYSKNVQNWIQYTQSQKTQIVNQHKKMKGFAYKKITLR